MAERIALGLEYDGSSFRGWQTQPGGGTVQDCLEAALGRIQGAPLRTTTAGRTDAGVHAAYQVVHFDSVAARPLSAWVRGVNTHLPPSIAVLWARAVPPAFDARRSALERTYRYFLFNRDVRPALLAGRAGWLHGTLDLDVMNVAAQTLIGTHDFSAFRAAGCQAKTPVRDLRAAVVERHGDFVVFEFRANAFLHHQVRNLVGALVWVGLRRRPPEWIAELLASRDRTQCAATFAPDGLYLAGVRYDDRFGLPPPQSSPFTHCPP